MELEYLEIIWVTSGVKYKKFGCGKIKKGKIMESWSCLEKSIVPKRLNQGTNLVKEMLAV